MKINRRDLLAASAGIAGAAGFGLPGIRPAFAQEPTFTPEAGASLRLLRWLLTHARDVDLLHCYSLAALPGTLLAGKLLGKRVMARDFDRQVAELQIRPAILNRFTALGTPETHRIG